MEKSSFSNIEQQSLEFVKYTLDPWVIRWGQALKKIPLSAGGEERVFYKAECGWSARKLSEPNERLCRRQTERLAVHQRYP